MSINKIMEDFIMATSEPIRNTNDIQRIKQYLLMRKRWRDYALITMGLNKLLNRSKIWQNSETGPTILCDTIHL